MILRETMFFHIFLAFFGHLFLGLPWFTPQNPSPTRGNHGQAATEDRVRLAAAGPRKSPGHVPRIFRFNLGLSMTPWGL